MPAIFSITLIRLNIINYSRPVNFYLLVFGTPPSSKNVFLNPPLLQEEKFRILKIWWLKLFLVKRDERFSTENLGGSSNRSTQICINKVVGVKGLY